MEKLNGANKRWPERADFEAALMIYQAIGAPYSEARAQYRLGDCAMDEEQWALAAYP